MLKKKVNPGYDRKVCETTAHYRLLPICLYSCRLLTTKNANSYMKIRTGPWSNGWSMFSFRSCGWPRACSMKFLTIIKVIYNLSNYWRSMVGQCILYYYSKMQKPTSYGPKNNERAKCYQKTLILSPGNLQSLKRITAFIVVVFVASQTPWVVSEKDLDYTRPTLIVHLNTHIIENICITLKKNLRCKKWVFQEVPVLCMPSISKPLLRFAGQKKLSFVPIWRLVPLLCTFSEDLCHSEVLKMYHAAWYYKTTSRF